MRLPHISLIDAQRVFGFLAVQLFIALSKALTIRRIGTTRNFDRQPRVSILVPARDE